MKPDYPKATWRAASPANYGKRPLNVKIDSIILHATAGGLSGTFGHFSNPNSRVSAHYVVAKDGQVYQMVEESKRAQHAGRSLYHGRQNFNDFSIGIEIVNKNDGKDPYPPEQIDGTVELIAYLVQKYGIEREWILSHAAVSTAHKTDPRNFPMAEVIDRAFEQDAPESNPD